MILLALWLVLPRLAIAQVRTPSPPVGVPAVAIPRFDLPALLLGSLQDSASPLRIRMEFMAGRLIELAPAPTLPAESWGRALEPLTRPEAHPIDRAAALGLARALNEGPHRSAAWPPAVERAAQRVEPSSPFRGDFRDPRSTLSLLAYQARRDPALTAAFDGAPPRLELEGLYFKDGDLRVDGAKPVKPFVHGRRSAIYEHPLLPGVVIKRYNEPINGPVFLSALSPSSKALALDDIVADRLAAARAGPRHFGSRLVAEAKISPLTSYVIGVWEQVYAMNVARLIERRLFDEAAYGLVGNLLDQLAEARLVPSKLGPDNILVGWTAANPSPSAFLLGAGSLADDYNDYSADELRDLLASRGVPDYDRDGKWFSLRSVLRRGVRRSSENAGLGARLKDGLADLIKPLGRIWQP